MLRMPRMKKPKIILFDLETLMHMEQIAKRFPSMSAYPGRTLKASINTIICFGYKELGKKRAKCINAWDFKSRWKKDVNDDYAVCKAAYEVLKEADEVVTHNGKRFDWKFLQSRLAFHGLPLLPKIKHTDTCQLAKSNLFLYDNKLNTVAEHLGCEQKLAHTGWQMWVDVLNRKVKAQNLMAKYCKQDVDVLEQVYLELRPFSGNASSTPKVINDDKRECPTCSSNRLYKHGKRATKTKIYQRYRCEDCGSYCTDGGTKKIPKTVRTT